MYTIKINNILAHKPSLNEDRYMLTDPVLTMEDNSAGSFSFSAAPINAAYDQIEAASAWVDVYKDDALIWRGRILDDGDDFHNTRSVTAEGFAAVLNDSLFPPEAWEDLADLSNVTISQVVTAIINNHNSQVEAAKQITIGSLPTTIIPEEKLNKMKKTDYEKSKSALDEVVSAMGGHWRIDIRETRGTFYLYFVYQMDETVRESNQVIRFGKNLIDIKRSKKASEICTVLIPTGSNNITIEDITGKNYIEDTAAIAKYGKFWRKETFDTDDENELLKLAQEYLAKQNAPDITIEANAVDLSLLDETVQEFRIGDSVQVISKPHNIDTKLTISQIRLDMDDPGKSEFTLGTPAETLV